MPASGGSLLMDDVAGLSDRPDLSSIDFSNIVDVRARIRDRHYRMFGVFDDGYVNDYLTTVENLFAGNHPHYQAMDTAYHDISHTLQATLCLVELLHNRQLAGERPQVEPEHFKRALIGVLFHDIGYLKELDDTEGTGAKYTHIHEKRSCRLIRTLLTDQGWSEDAIVFVENLISATGPLADVSRIPFRSEIERVLGQAVCTADYIGQMSDPAYPDKLPVLFREFEESYRYQDIPEEKWPFTSYEQLLRGTPGFWSVFVRRKMIEECAGIWKHLENPVTGDNPYLESIEANLATINGRIKGLA